MQKTNRTSIAILLVILFVVSALPTFVKTTEAATSDWTPTSTQPLKAYPDLRESQWQKVPTALPNGPYDRIALHRLNNPALTPKGVVFVIPGLYGNGETYVSNPPTDNYTKFESNSQCIYWANRGFDVYTMDYRQHFIPIDFNKSQLAFAAEWGMDQVMSDIKECIDKAKQLSGANKVFLAGLSYGGILAQFYASKNWQQDLNGLILLDPGPSKSTVTKNQNLTSTVNVTSLVNAMNAQGSWMWENPQQSNTPHSANPGYIFMLQLAVRDPGAPVQYANGTLITSINPRTNKTYTNITEFLEYAFNNAKSTNSYGGYGDITVAINRAASGDRYYPLKIFIDGSAQLDWPVSPNLSFDYAAHINEINVPVIAYRSGLNLAAYGNITNGMATKDFTWTVLPNYGHGDVFYGVYSARDVSQPAYQWMLDRSLGMTMTASSLSPLPGQPVTFTFTPDFPFASGMVTLRAYVNGVEQAMWSIPFSSTTKIDFIPSLIGNNVTWQATTGLLSSNIITTTTTTPSAPTQVTLSASVLSQMQGVVQFRVSASPATTALGTLTAYSGIPGSSGATAVGSWSVGVVNGVGNVLLKPDLLGSAAITWQFSIGNVKSNTLSTPLSSG